LHRRSDQDLVVAAERIDQDHIEIALLRQQAFQSGALIEPDR
jgi:hypothetical protein